MKIINVQMKINHKYKIIYYDSDAENFNNFLYLCVSNIL